MRLGILADIHGDVTQLQIAIARLREAGVDRFVVLGDVIYDANQSAETVALLEEIEAIGVFGNHELGLCNEPEEEIFELFDSSVMSYFAKLTPHLLVGDVRLSHNLPTQDATDPYDYYLGKKPNDPDALRECFAAFPQRIMLIGHYHRWMAASTKGRFKWKEGQTISLDPNERYLFVIHAVMDGWAALLDDVANELMPISLH